MQQSTIEITTWKKISKKFHSVNDPLARVIDKISPDDSFKLYRVRYPFGEMVFKMGILNKKKDSQTQWVILFRIHTIP